jgi:glutathione S-transferase
METDQVLHQQLPSAYRQLQPQAAQAISHGQPAHLQHHAHSLASQAGLDLTGLEDPDSVFNQDLRLQDPNGHSFQNALPYDRNHGHQPMHIQNNGSPHTPQRQHNGGQFGVLRPLQHNSIDRLQQQEDLFGTPDGSDQKSNGHLSTKIVENPPNLAEWRQKLFDVNEMITLSEEE